MVETEAQLIEQYVTPGRARLIYRHLLQLGAGSLALAEASECAGAQGKFWEMRELIYRRQAHLARPAGPQAVQPLVTDLALDAGRFTHCLEQHQFRQQVEADDAAAQRAGIGSRPILDVNGTRIVGAQPLAQYQRVLDARR